MLLTADIGEQRTDVAIVVEHDVRTIVARETFETRDWDDLLALVGQFLEEHDTSVDRAAMGVPGPVVAGGARSAGLPWEVSAERVREQLGLRSVVVMNDLEAIAWAVPALEADELATVCPGEPVADGTVGVLAPGAGLGAAFVVRTGRGYRAQPSEGGRTAFAPTTEEQRDLLAYLAERLPEVCWEHVCSGQGLSRLYAFVRDTGRAEEPGSLRAELLGTEDPSRLILEAACRRPPPPICRLALDLFVEALGAAVRSFALTVSASGGVYLGGAIPPLVVGELRRRRFLHAVRRGGSDLLERLPVHVVREPRITLVGLAHAGSRAELLGI